MGRSKSPSTRTLSKLGCFPNEIAPCEGIVLPSDDLHKAALNGWNKLQGPTSQTEKEKSFKQKTEN